MAILTPIKAIYLKRLNCSNDWRKEVKEVKEVKETPIKEFDLGV